MGTSGCNAPRTRCGGGTEPKSGPHAPTLIASALKRPLHAHQKAGLRGRHRATRLELATRKCQAEI